jgi:hypothetical protein
MMERRKSYCLEFYQHLSLEAVEDADQAAVRPALEKAMGINHWLPMA